MPCHRRGLRVLRPKASITLRGAPRVSPRRLPIMPVVSCRHPIPSHPEPREAYASGEEGRACRLDGLDFGCRQRRPLEAGRQLAAIEEDALGRLDRAECRAGRATNATLSQGFDGLAEGPVLLDLVPIRAERCVRRRRASAGEARGKGARGAGRMRLGGVVDGRCGAVSSPGLVPRVGNAEGKEETEDRSPLAGARRTRNGPLPNELDQGCSFGMLRGLAQASGC